MLTASVDINIPEARLINYTDVDEICGYQQLLCRKFEQSGGFAYPYKANAAIRQVQSQGLVWLKKVRGVIDGIIDGSDRSGLTLGAVPRMLNSYDFLYRVCNGRPVSDYTRKVRLRSVDRWLKGDDSLSETDAVIGLLLESERDGMALDDRYMVYAYSVMDKWISELTAERFSGLPFQEAYARLTYLLRSDLFAYFGTATQPEIKAKWVRANTLSDSQLDLLSPMELMSYISFTQTVAYLGTQTPEEQDELYVSLHSRLASHSGLHPFYRQSIEIDLANYLAA